MAAVTIFSDFEAQENKIKLKKKSMQVVTAAMKLKDAYSLEEKL